MEARRTGCTNSDLFFLSLVQPRVNFVLNMMNRLSCWNPYCVISLLLFSHLYLSACTKIGFSISLLTKYVSCKTVTKWLGMQTNLNRFLLDIFDLPTWVGTRWLVHYDVLFSTIYLPRGIIEIEEIAKVCCSISFLFWNLVWCTLFSGRENHIHQSISSTLQHFLATYVLIYLTYIKQ